MYDSWKWWVKGVRAGVQSVWRAVVNIDFELQYAKLIYHGRVLNMEFGNYVNAIMKGWRVANIFLRRGEEEEYPVAHCGTWKKSTSDQLSLFVSVVVIEPLVYFSEIWWASISVGVNICVSFIQGNRGWVSCTSMLEESTNEEIMINNHNEI